MSQVMHSRSVRLSVALFAIVFVASAVVVRADVPPRAELAAIACAPQSIALVAASTPLFAGTSLHVGVVGGFACPAGQSGCMPGMCNCGGIGQPQCCDGTCVCVCATSCCSSGDGCEVRVE